MRTNDRAQTQGYNKGGKTPFPTSNYQGTTLHNPPSKEVQRESRKTAQAGFQRKNCGGILKKKGCGGVMLRKAQEGLKLPKYNGKRTVSNDGFSINYTGGQNIDPGFSIKQEGPDLDPGFTISSPNGRETDPGFYIQQDTTNQHPLLQAARNGKSYIQRMMEEKARRERLSNRNIYRDTTTVRPPTNY